MYRTCDGLTRRDFIRVGILGSSGLTLADYLRRLDAGTVAPAKGKSAIFVYLGGGPTHLDTFDMKPDAPAEVRGEFRPIHTNVPGIEICEHLPRLARCADKFAIVRGVSHTLAGHELGTMYLNTGNRPIPSLVYPGYGAVISKELPGDPDLPHFVAIPNTPQTPGYLGVRYAPLQTNTTPVAGQPFSVRGISLGGGLTVAEFQKRRDLLRQLDTTFQGLEKTSRLIDGLDKFDQQAFAMISSPRARQAFDISQEAPSVAQAFGQGRFGVSCLLALRLIEAGVRFVTVTFGGWDTHANNFRVTKDTLLPQLDQGLAALLTMLSAKGLLESTTVFVTGEFGRTPKINDRAGRDHWPRAMVVLLAGGGIRGGQVVGGSDAHGAGPKGDAITPDQVAASFYHSLGIDHRKEYQTSTGRPVMIVRDGAILRDLFG
ncbi:MAG: DUF1501 domain-containing protein [Gemmataceae bacterium]|nr:DUF1501 domain-containing protein [Gemmataceae bacterium]MDW8267216.1 DUF1501 domain-containing protein [Gemmataceae bacterium]